MIAAIFLTTTLLDFSCPPATLSALQPRLEEALEAKVAIGTDLKDEVVVIHATGIEPEVLKAKIARAVCGRWEEGPPGRWLLTLDHAEEKRREAALRARYAEAFRLRREARMAPYLDAMRSPWNARELGIELTSKWNRRLRERLPWEMMAAEIMRAISPDDVARAAMGETMVLSNRPGRYVSPISAAVDGIVRKRAPQISELEKVLAGMGWAQTAEYGLAAGQAERQRYRHWPDPPYWILFHPGSPHMNSLVIADDKGDLIDSPFFSLTAADMFAQGEAWPVPFAAKHAELLKEPDWADEVMEKAFETGRLKITIPSGEPLELRFRDTWADWAKAEEAPICLNLPDALSDDSFARTPALAAHETVFGQLAENEITVKKDADGWIVGEAAYPSQTRRERTPRLVLHRYFEAVAKGKMPTVEEQLRTPGWVALALRDIDPLWGVPASQWSLTKIDPWYGGFAALSPEFLQSGLKGFRGTMADLSGRDQRVIQDWLMATGMDSTPSNVKLAEPAYLFEHSALDQFSVVLEARIVPIVVCIRRADEGTDGMHFGFVFEEEMMKRLREEDAGKYVAIGGGTQCELTLTIRHESGAYAQRSLPLTSYELRS